QSALLSLHDDDSSAGGAGCVRVRFFFARGSRDGARRLVWLRGPVGTTYSGSAVSRGQAWRNPVAGRLSARRAREIGFVQAVPTRQRPRNRICGPVAWEAAPDKSDLCALASLIP